MKKVGLQTIKFQNPPLILEAASVVGPLEGGGPLKSTYDLMMTDTLFGQESWEKAEQKMLEEAVNTVIIKAGFNPEDIDFLLAGDLLNQTISANFTARQLGIPFFGLYGACSTMFEGLILSSILIDGEYANTVIAAASSHHNTAERQYRFPTELGVQRPPTAQWTVTGAGAMLIGRYGVGPRITYATVGKVVDLGIKDPNNLGAAMAPAAADTIVQHFVDTRTKSEDYDLIFTGDLASIGLTLAKQLIDQQGYTVDNRFIDCGQLIYDPEQDIHAGGSGCGCSAVVTAGHILQNLRAGTYKKILGVGTGALLSPLSSLQGETIPGIGHAVVIEYP